MNEKDIEGKAEQFEAALEGLMCAMEELRKDRDRLKALLTAQPEIIRCKDCKHMQEDEIFHQCWCDGKEVKPDHFCGYAERRTDG